MKHWLVRLVIGLLATLGLTISSASHASSKASVDYTDVFALEYVSNPQFSANGKVVFFQRRSMDKLNDRVVSSIWQVDVETQQNTPLLQGIEGLRGIALSPRNDRLAYVANTSSGAQIFVHYIAQNRTIQLTELKNSPQQLTWSNDAETLYFTQKVDSAPLTLFDDMPKPPKNASWAEQPQVIDSVLYRADGGGYLTPGFTHVFRVPATGGIIEQITHGEQNYRGKLAISPDDNTLFVASNDHATPELAPLVQDIFAIDVGSQAKPISKVTNLTGREYSPSISPDGKWLAYLHTEDKNMAYHLSEVVLHSLENSNKVRLTAQLDRRVVSFAWAKDSSHLVFSYLDAGRTKLAEARLNGDIIGLSVEIGGQSLGRPYTSGEFALSTNGSIAYTSATTLHPAELMLVSDNESPIQLTQINTDLLNARSIAPLQSFTVTSSVDKNRIDAWYVLPPNFDAAKKYPLILEIHGGPHAAYGPHFSMEVQLMAAKGYIVVWANPRGSSSYGAEFGNLIHHNYPSDDYQDLMDVVDAMEQNKFVDSDNLFITGGSGGGVLTAWSIGKTNRFRAAVVAKPVINWISFALTADNYPFYTQYWMAAKPWEDHTSLWKLSPLSLVGNVQTPTMLLTGEADYRTPISETEQYYQALKLRQVDAVMVRIPGASHGIASKPTRLIQKVGNIIAWFDKYKTRHVATKDSN